MTAKPALANTLPDLLLSNSQEAFASAGEEGPALHSASGHGRSSSQESLLLHMYVLRHCQEESLKQIPHSLCGLCLDLGSGDQRTPPSRALLPCLWSKKEWLSLHCNLNSVPLLSVGMQEVVSVPLNGENGAPVVSDHVTAQDPRMESSLPTQ